MSRITINTNIQALTAGRRLAQSTASLNESFERLSSGLRINSAGDDASGLALSSSLDVDAQVFDQGARNLNDGVSLLSIADSTVAELSNIVIRIEELAEQAANGTITTVQRAALDKEAQALAKEFTRISASTEFNGLKLFDGTFDDMSFQAGYGDSGQLNLGVGGAVGDGTFRVDSTVTGVSRARRSDVADVDGDGHLDIVSGSDFTDNFEITFGNGDGTFTDAVEFSSGMGGRTYGAGIEDFNGDGIADVATVNHTANRVSIFIGDGNRNFTNVQNMLILSPEDQPEFGDFNNDGVVDIMVTEFYNNNASIFYGNGDGSFQVFPQAVHNAAGDLAEVEVADFNGDGYDDFVASSAAGNQISVGINNGAGGFDITNFANPTSGQVAIGDVNNDGALDFVAISNTDFVTFEGDGGGGFTIGQTSTGSVGVWDSDLYDINADGNLDLVFAGAGNPIPLGIRFGNGDGTFEDTVTSTGTGTSATLPVGLAMGDFNEDGAVDVGVSSWDQNNIQIFLSNTDDGLAALPDFSLRTKFGAMQTLTLMDHTRARLNLQRGTIGAGLSRLDTAVNILQDSSVNYSQASSRIKDVDVAEEAASLSRKSILQQAGAAILAQANLNPNLALRLLS